MYYTYLHFKADSGELFYVGKGKRARGRANSHLNRSQYWHRVVAKHGLRVEIAASWSDEETAYLHEKFLIACFRDIGVPLVNLTDGGDGVRGLRHSKEFSAWQSERVKREYLDPVKREVKAAAQRRRFASDAARREHSVKIRAAWTPEMRAAAAERTKAMQAANGHPSQKINDAMLASIQQMLDRGETLKRACAAHGITRTHAGIVLNKWRQRTGRIRSAHPNLKVLIS
jgi:hypothetical protein